MNGIIQRRAIMPIPTFPAMIGVNELEVKGMQCCRDCQAAETLQRLKVAHPTFSGCRTCVANDRVEGLVMPFGMMEHYGLCKVGVIRPCSVDDLNTHLSWLESHGIEGY